MLYKITNPNEFCSKQSETWPIAEPECQWRDAAGLELERRNYEANALVTEPRWLMSNGTTCNVHVAPFQHQILAQKNNRVWEIAKERVNSLEKTERVACTLFKMENKSSVTLGKACNSRNVKTVLSK